MSLIWILFLSLKNFKPKTIRKKSFFVSKTKNYHSRSELINQFLRKIISIAKLQILLILNIHNSKKTKYKYLLCKAYEDLFIGFRYRMKQFIFLEPLYIHAKGWSGLFKNY